MTKTGRIFLFLNIILLSIYGLYASGNSESPSKVRVLVNQIGYYKSAVKIALITNTTSEIFSLKKASDNTICFTAPIPAGSEWDAAKENIAIADFSDYDVPGTYTIVLSSGIESYPFEISESLYRQPAEMLLKSFYYQRADIDILPIYGGKWSWENGHPQDGESILHPSTGATGTWSSPGGWYDAGDYGKYIVNGGITVGTLLNLYEMFPDLIGDNLVIPESGNGVSDLLDEVRYELEWMLSMQDTDGGVFFKQSGLRWPGMDVKPSEDTQKRYIIGKSTTSTLNFTAVMAMAARIYSASDSVFAKQCRQAALDGWKWSSANPSISHPDTGISGSGPYDDTKYEDEFFWAASELFITTEDTSYLRWITDHSEFATITGPAWWGDVKNLGVYSLLCAATESANKITGTAEYSLILTADSLLSEIDQSPGRVPMNKHSFAWGSFGTVGNKGIILAYAHYLTNDSKYLSGLIEIGDYLSGRNVTGYTSSTGLGDNPPMFPHHRPSVADNIKEPVPGLVVGGPNPGRQDGQTYLHIAPARCYIDITASYSSNEPAINQNASVIFVFAYLTAMENK